MPIVKINKQLDRPDGGKVASGSIAVCNEPRQVINKKTVVFLMPIFLNQTAIDNKKSHIPALVLFPIFKLIYKCTDEEWAELIDDSSAGAYMGLLMEKAIAAQIGDGFTELIG